MNAVICRLNSNYIAEAHRRRLLRFTIKFSDELYGISCVHFEQGIYYGIRPAFVK